MAVRVLTSRELNRALLARQLLLERARLPIPRALERIAGIQNQYAPNAYIRLASCLEGFRGDDLDRALERRTAVQGTLMRTTIHAVSARDYRLFSAGLRRTQQAWHVRVHRADARTMRKKAAALRAVLQEGPRSAKELGELGKGHVGLWTELVRVPPSGTWAKRRADLYALADQWLGRGEATEKEGLAHLVRRYLGGFGPAALEDAARWAGVKPAALAPALDRLRLRRFRDEDGRELLDLRGAPLPPADTPAPVRFLPTWDNALLVHARRAGVLPEEYRPLVFDDKHPPSVPTFLVDGRVAGAWSHENGRIVLEPFERISRAARRELAEESERIGSLYA